MSKEVDLLRMLGPAVRPGQVGGAGGSGRRPVAPIEQISFDSVLEQARAMNGAEAAPGDAPAGQADTPGPRASLLDRLAPLDRVANASLRVLMAGRGQQAEIG